MPDKIFPVPTEKGARRRVIFRKQEQAFKDERRRLALREAEKSSAWSCNRYL